MLDTCTDRLDALLRHHPVRARLFQSGALCGLTNFDAAGSSGQLHLVRAGRLEVIHPGQPPLTITEPTLLLYPRPMARRFVALDDTVLTTCANLHFEGGAANPIAQALPDVVQLPLAAITGVAPALALLFDEVANSHCGRREMCDRLFEVILILLLRQLMESHSMPIGLLAGLSHPKLRKALVAMHEQPAEPWSLQSLATVAGMSRSAFAKGFHAAVGTAPAAYLQGWRVRQTQLALKKGQPLKRIALDVGYGSEAALSRVFKAQCGVSPRQWLQGAGVAAIADIAP